MPPIDACYSYAGFCGVNPKGLTLNHLWRMANGKSRHIRFENSELAQLVWAADIDMEKYLLYGIIESTGAGGRVRLSPELEGKVRAEVERLRNENPDHPKVSM